MIQTIYMEKVYSLRVKAVHTIDSGKYEKYPNIIRKIEEFIAYCDTCPMGEEYSSTNTNHVLFLRKLINKMKNVNACIYIRDI